MEILDNLLDVIANTENCSVSKNESLIVLEIGYDLPSDLKYYLENYKCVKLFQTAEYPFYIVGTKNFQKANPIIAGCDVEDDSSNMWFIVASDNNSQYITIDLAKERLGRCYDSFQDRHGIVGEQPIIANSFTELLQALYNNQGGYPYWLREEFKNIGDAYDDL
jgi:hypothetical protein